MQIGVFIDFGSRNNFYGKKQFQILLLNYYQTLSYATENSLSFVPKTSCRKESVCACFIIASGPARDALAQNVGSYTASRIT